jgi:hypothetical protein
MPSPKGALAADPTASCHCNVDCCCDVTFDLNVTTSLAVRLNRTAMSPAVLYIGDSQPELLGRQIIQGDSNSAQSMN